jgi:hypothetical protein
MYRVLAVALALIVALLAMPSGHCDHARTHHSISLEEKRQIIAERLRFYNAGFPMIRFVHVGDGSSWREELLTVISLLGEGAVNLDYEHPPELAGELLEANIERLAQMLEHDIVSAALFRVGQGSPVKRSTLCVVSLNPHTYIGDSVDAVSYMLDLSAELLAKVHPARLLDTYEHLRFTVDHEAFHCIESHLFGGARMTRLPLGGEYNLFLRESGADAFALGMHLRRAGVRTEYARNITHVRALWLFTESPNRCTYDSMRAMLNRPPERLASRSVREIVDLAVRVRDRWVGSYEFYVWQRSTAFKAAKQLGHAPALYGDAWKGIEQVPTEPAEVEYKIERYRYYFSQLFTDEPVAFTPADLQHDPASGATAD